MALRLERFIGKLVHPDQTGFIPKRHAADNIRRLLHVIEEARNLPTPSASLDAEKAFDRLEWNYLWQVMETLGLGFRFISMVQTLYADPTAIVSTNGLHSAISHSTWLTTGMPTVTYAVCTLFGTIGPS